MGEMEDYLDTECPDIEFTSVRCPQLSNAESTGTLVTYVHWKFKNIAILVHIEILLMSFLQIQTSHR